MFSKELSEADRGRLNFFFISIISTSNKKKNNCSQFVESEVVGCVWLCCRRDQNWIVYNTDVFDGATATETEVGSSTFQQHHQHKQ